MRVIVIRHHAEDSPGLIADAFTARGAELRTHLFPGEGELPALDGVDHVVVLGASSSVNDSGPSSMWIQQELAWLRQADETGVPVLGICFGAQALCAAFGGQVEAAPGMEIGWKLVESADPSLIPVGPWLEFYGDRCLPPAGATILATNKAGVQAFTIGRNLAVQFHPEANRAQLVAWLDAGASAQARAAGVDPDEFLAQAAVEEPAARQRAAALVDTALRLARVG